MAKRGRGRRGRGGLEPEVATKPAPQAIKVPAPSPVPEIDLYTMPPQELPQAVIAPPKGQPIQIPVGVAPVVAPPVAVAPPPPPVAPAPAPVPIPQIDPAVLAQIQQQFNIPAPAPAPVKEVAPPPPPPVQVAPPRIEEPPKAPPVQVPLPPVIDVPPAQGFMPEPLPSIKEPVKQVAPPPPPVEVAPPPPPVSPGPIGLPAGFEIPEDILSRGTVGPVAPPPVQVPPPVVQPAPAPPVPPAIPQIDPEILAQIQQEFNIPAAPPAPPVAPPVQVPPPVVQPAPPPAAAVAPPPPPVQVPPPTFVDEFEEPLAMDGMRGGPRSGIGSLPEAPPEAVVPPPVQVPPTVVQPDPVTPPIDPSLYGDPDLGVEPSFGGPRGAAGLNQGPRPELSGPSGAAGMGGDDVTGIETMAPAVGFGDYINSEVNEAGVPAGAQPGLSDTISLPDGSTFDLGSLDLSGIGQDLGGFELGNINLGGVDPSLYSDPDLGGGQEPEFDRGNIGFGPVAVDGGYSYDGNGNEINGGPASGAPVFNPPQGIVDEAEGTTFTPEFAADPGLDFSNLDLSGLNLNLGEGFDANGFEPDFTFGGPQGGPGMGNGPGNTVGDQGNQGDDPYNPTVNDTGNPYPFIPDGVNTDGMTPETLAGLNNYYEMYPNGFNIDLSGIGGSFPGGFMGGSTGGTGTTGGSYTVDPVDQVGDLGVGDNTGDPSDPIDVTTPYVVPDVRSASSFGLTGATQTSPVSANPFVRPESQQGLGSLAGGG